MDGESRRTKCPDGYRKARRGNENKPMSCSSILGLSASKVASIKRMSTG
jgi:hypothetical protein